MSTHPKKYMKYIFIFWLKKIYNIFGAKMATTLVIRQYYQESPLVASRQCPKIYEIYFYILARKIYNIFGAKNPAHRDSSSITRNHPVRVRVTVQKYMKYIFIFPPNFYIEFYMKYRILTIQKLFLMSNSIFLYIWSLPKL